MANETNEGELVAGRYRVVRHLGRGGMGDVVVARHETIAREVALKRMHSEHASKPDARARMLREARAMGALRHDNIVDVIDAGEDGSGLYIAMELVAGETLRERMKRGVPVPLALDLLAQIAEGLAAAHDADVVHRDLKPENVMITPAGRAKILDFGLARAVENAETVTEHGVVVGTPGYIAPEVGTRGAYGAPADMYALGVIAFELYTGKAPYTAPTGMSLLLKHITEPVPSPRLSPELDALVLECMAKEPERRPTPRAFAARCRALIDAGSSPTLTSAMRTPDPQTLPTPATTPTVSTAPVAPVAPVASSSNKSIMIGAIAGFALFVVIAAAFIIGRQTNTPEAPRSSAPLQLGGMPSGPLRVNDPFPRWNLTRVPTQQREPKKWGPTEWRETPVLAAVVAEPGRDSLALLKELERVRMTFPTVNVTLVVAGNTMKTAVDDALAQGAATSSVDVVTGYMPSIGEPPETTFVVLGYDRGRVTHVMRGLAAHGSLDAIASNISR